MPFGNSPFSAALELFNSLHTSGLIFLAVSEPFASERDSGSVVVAIPSSHADGRLQVKVLEFMNQLWIYPADAFYGGAGMMVSAQSFPA